jgi:hypothetical protein
MDNFRRILSINSVARKTNPAITQSVSFSSPYILRGDSIVLDTPFSGTVLNNNITIKSIKFSTLNEGTINVCPDPITVHLYSGVTSANDAVILETTLSDANGANFSTASTFYFSPLGYISQNGEPLSGQITTDLPGAGSMQLYYNYNIGSGTPFYGIGFLLQNTNGTTTFALRQFTPTVTGNKVAFSFAPTVSVFGNMNPDANKDNINIYLNLLTDGDNTYVFQLQEDVYEFYNPCTQFSVVFVNGGQ